MRTLFCCVLCILSSAAVSAQDVEQLRQIIDKNAPKSLPATLGKQTPETERVSACKTAFEAADKMLATATLPDNDRLWALQQKASALILLAYAEPPRYYAQLAAVSDELRPISGKPFGKMLDTHTLIVGAPLALSGKNDEDGSNLKAAAERMTAFAEQYPEPESNKFIDDFLAHIRSLSLPERDARLAIVAPVFMQYFQKINYTKKMQVLEQEYKRATLVGNPMYLAGADLNGNPFDVNQLKGKIVLVQFWGTWCPNCKKEMAPLIRLYEKYHAAGLEIIGINTAAQGDKNATIVKDFIASAEFEGKKIPWTILHEGLGEQKRIVPVSQRYGIHEIPVLILVGRNGKVLRTHPTVGSLDAAIAAEAK